MHILIAEDDPLARATLTAFLEVKGHTIDSVDNGSVAYERLASGRKYDLLFTDLHMPLIGGLELIRLARKKGLLHCPVVVHTGYDVGWVQGVAGVDYILSKPMDEVQINMILQETQQCLESSGPMA